MMKYLLSVLAALFFSVPSLSHCFEYEYAQPSYDSGWHTIAQGQAKIFTHNIGGNVGSYVVDLQTRNDPLANLQFKSLHNRLYGGQIRNGGIEGATWYGLDSSAITVYRGPNDDVCQEIRIRIWKIAGADYDSGWQSYQQNEIKILTHDLGGPVDEYVVYMEFQDTSFGSIGIHQNNYGGVQDSSGWYGAQWARLTSSAITVARLAQDFRAENIRVRIWRVKHPDYDSGWQSLSQGQDLVLEHGVNNPFSDFTVYLEFKDLDNNVGINHVYFGGLETGTQWNGGYLKDFTGSSITLRRNVNDIVADQMRVRLWKCSAPRYDSGWLSTDPGQNLLTLNHSLNGLVTDDYIVGMEFRDAPGSANNRYLGGTDFYLTAPQPGFSAYGAYWYHFNNQQIYIWDEEPENFYQMRIRVWLPPKADIDSGWIDPRDTLVNPVSFGNLGGSPEDYFVYIEGKDEDFGGKGRNNYHIGGDTYLYNSSFYDSGFYWSQLTTTSITLNVGTYTLSDKIRVRIWKKKGGRITVASLNLPAQGDHTYSTASLSAADYVFDLQLTYQIGYGLSNKSTGGVISRTDTSSGLSGAFWTRDDSLKQGKIYALDNYSNMHLYAWDASWQPKQKMRGMFFWPMYLPAMTKSVK